MSGIGVRAGWAGAILATLVVLLAPATAVAQPRPPEQLRVAVTGVSAADAGLLMAKEAGLFEPLGLEVELLFFGSGTEGVQALVSGHLPVITAGAPPVINAVLAGAPLVLVAELLGTVPYTLVVSPDIATPAGLRGKRLGISRFGSSSDFALRLALGRLGVEPERDVTLLQLGGQAVRLAALRAGSIAGTMIGKPSTVIAAELGLRELIDLTELGLPYPHECLVTTREFLDRRRDTLRKLITGIAGGTHRFKTNREDGLRVLQKYLKADEREALAATYDEFRRLLHAKPFVSLEGVQLILEQLAPRDPRARAAKPADFVDSGVVQELDASGFIDRLYRGAPVP